MKAILIALLALGSITTFTGCISVASKEKAPTTTTTAPVVRTY